MRYTGDMTADVATVKKKSSAFLIGAHASMRTEEERLLLDYIRNSAKYWGIYKRWIIGAPKNRGFFMHQQMRDLVCAAALLYGERRKRVKNNHI